MYLEVHGTYQGRLNICRFGLQVFFRIVTLFLVTVL